MILIKPFENIHCYSCYGFKICILTRGPFFGIELLLRVPLSSWIRACWTWWTLLAFGWTLEMPLEPCWTSLTPCNPGVSKSFSQAIFGWNRKTGWSQTLVAQKACPQVFRPAWIFCPRGHGAFVLFVAYSPEKKEKKLCLGVKPRVMRLLLRVKFFFGSF